jgi:leucyl aminopeptidase (aminopeptidase T)
MEGRIVFDELMKVGVLRDARVEFVMEKGRITEFLGGVEAATMKQYVEELNDKNMFKISHMMISLNPGIRELTGSVVIDERIYGGIDLGFGHTSPSEAPPLGQPAKSHFDGMIEKTSIWIDEVQITELGKVVHPVLAPISDAMLEYANR